ncbi:MAG: hypothetical protein FWG38_07900 [Defluviitaleaceae bacterium]|nr:hypothetical protein [Defluviitaleaceae bacterium]
MKKFAQMLLAMLLVLGLALPAMAHERPAFQTLESFDFSMDFTLSLDLLEDPAAEPVMNLIFGGPEVAVNITGSTVSDGELATQMYMEILLGTGMFGTAPIRIWSDIDLNDLEDITMTYIVELPAALRMMLALQNRELGRQFMVLDLGETLTDALADITFPTEEEIEALMAELEEMMEEAMEALRDIDFAAIWGKVTEFIDVLNFDFGWSQDEDGYFTGLNLALEMILDPADRAVELGLGFDVAITNINEATVELPELTDTNSVCLVSLF